MKLVHETHGSVPLLHICKNQVKGATHAISAAIQIAPIIHLFGEATRGRSSP